MTAPTIDHDPAAHRFRASLEGKGGVLDYSVANGVMTIVHTEVDKALEGRGVGGALVQAALAEAAAKGLKVQPDCPYADSYMQRHPESAALRA